MVELERNYPFTGYPIEPLTIYELWPGQPIHDWRERERERKFGRNQKSRKFKFIHVFFIFRQRFGIMQATGPRRFQAQPDSTEDIFF